MHFLSYFIILNKKVNSEPSPMPNINEMLLTLESFQYAMSIDVNMGYYFITLRYYTSTLCTMILPWKGYCHKRLPMVIANFLDIFQQEMNYLFHGFEFIRAYIDELLILIKGY